MSDMILVGSDGNPAPQDGQQEQGQSEARREHHAQRQPREVGRFAGPPAPKDEGAPAEQPAKPAKRVYEFTADRATGAKKRVELGDEDMPQVLAKAHGFDRHAEEFAKYRKEVEQERQATKALQAALREGKDPHRAMRKFIESSGLTGERARDAATFLLHEYLEEESLTPEQRELKRYREMEAERQRQEEEAQEAEAEAAFKREVEEKRSVLVKTIEAAFARASEHGLPVNTHTLSHMGRLLLVNAQEGVEMTPEELAAHAREEVFGSLAQMTKGISGAQVRELLPDLYAAVRRDLRERARAGGKGAASAPTQRAAATPRRPDAPEQPIWIQR